MGEGVEGNGLVAPGSITSDLKPEETVNYELGTKWDVFHDRLSLTAAIFRTEKKNTRVLTDSGSPTKTPVNPALTVWNCRPAVKSLTNGKCLQATAT